MQFFTQLLILASTVSAVNINLYASSGQCSGNFVVCSNINANVCCGVSSGQAKGAIYFQNLPNPANVGTFGRGEGCNVQIRADRTTSPNWCVFNLANQITGGRWSFASKRRGLAEKEGDCLRPDTGVVQGRQFNLTTLDDTAFENFLEYMDSVEPTVPDQFLDSEILNSEGTGVAIN
ncbi:hypothetical protein BKA63DRAFT_21562 [Paraphoma chrysanthemicola]|nr:hypothetical protein BKA63DRAFT_21562 [Paraphoma chrysanthemicola]